ncbi:dynein light chain Tctex-type protein 2B-like [Ruditapes philippinarum]|uniref:dynein light chain Tctex-type protein 2B-like n=1 Tax=Ruditapes philippinarum TaxID=129788 RepID=UPI00295C164A|nr:dynein light chain Tctex-type protein 2B-like [Ruditapes philippinarum]
MPPKPQQPRRLTRENIENHSESMARKSFSEDLPSHVPLPQTTQPQMRRQSKFDARLMHMSQDRRFSTVSRTSISGASQTTKTGPPVKYENTYRTEPDAKFESYKVKNVMTQTLREWLTGVEYSPNVRKLTTGLTDEIKKRVKALGFQRYKFVVTVTICQDAKQSMQMVSRCMWNKDTDNFSEAVFKTADLHAVATLYACYFE